jgi:hypothetical protein
MKTIEEKACEYAENAYIVFPQSAVKSAFIAGYRAAQEWISVEDELPKDGTEILVKNTEWTDYMFYTSDDEDTIRAEYTHWRPINND